MTQAQWIVLAFKVGLISGFLSLAAWIVLYSLLAAWWRNPVGRTLVAKTALIAALFIPTTLSLFFHLSRLDSLIAGWVDVALIGLVTPVMLWRSWVWVKLHRAGRLPRNGHDGLGEAGEHEVLGMLSVRTLFHSRPVSRYTSAEPSFG